jgi:hypothetical protein
VRDLPSFPSVVSYCTAGTSSNGCVATMSASGTPSASASSGFVLSAHSLEGVKLGLFFYGTAGIAAVPMGLELERVVRQATDAAHGRASLERRVDAVQRDVVARLERLCATHPGRTRSAVRRGDEVWSQCWCRDPNSAKTTALSDALYFALEP